LAFHQLIATPLSLVRGWGHLRAPRKIGGFHFGANLALGPR